MTEPGTASFLKDVSEFFTGSAALYALDPPIVRRDIDPNGEAYIEHVAFVVAADAKIRDAVIGTTLYQSDETGYVTSWERLHENAILDTREEALAAIGYVASHNEEKGGEVNG